MNILKTHKENLIKLSILLFAYFPLIPNSIKGLPVIILFVAGIIYSHIDTSKTKYFLGFSFLFILYFFSMFYTSNIKYGLKELETTLSILVIPFSFFILLSKYQIKENLKLLFLKNFIIASTIFSIVSILAIVTNPTPFYKDFYSNKFRTVVKEIPFIGQHPIYASIFLALAIIFATISFSKLYQKKIIGISYILINLLLLLMLSSRSVISSLIITITIILFLIFKYTFQQKIIIFFVLVTSLILLFSYNRRMQELIAPETYKTISPNYSNSFRVAITNCSIKLIQKNFLFGYGVGDVQEKLNDCYKQSSSLLLKKTYNSHNQYLDIWLKTGIIGFIYFLSFIFYELVINLKNKNYLLFGIFLFYAIIFLFENILERQSGVILFYFLISFFTLENINNKHA